MVAILVAIAIGPTASHANVCSKAYGARQAVIKQHGERAPGRNICRYGVKHSNGKVRPAKYEQKKRYLFQLRALVRPPLYAGVRATLPRQLPAGTKTAKVVEWRGTSNPNVNPSCESGGNPQVVSPDGRYWGWYQFDYSTWVAHGGSPGSYGNAPLHEQHAIAANVDYDAWPNC
jgi:hypothetical protein